MRPLVRLGIALLCAGFVYHGLASVRLYARFFARPRAITGSSAADEYLAPAHVSDGRALREALREAGSRASDDVAVLADPGISRQDIYQVYYAASYALYPQRVWLASSEDDVVKRQARFVLALGGKPALLDGASRSVSTNLTLIDLQ